MHRKKSQISDFESALESLPDVTRGHARTWTKQQDELILKYCRTKGANAVATILGVNHSSVMRRLRFLEAV